MGYISTKVSRFGKRLENESPWSIAWSGITARARHFIPLLSSGHESASIPNFYDVLFINGCDRTLPHPIRYRVDHQVEQLRSAGLAVCSLDACDLHLEDVGLARSFVIFRCPWSSDMELFVRRAKELNKDVYFDIDDLVIDTFYTDQIPYVASMAPADKASYDAGVESYARLLKLCGSAITTTDGMADGLRRLVPNVFVNRNVASAEMVALSDAAYSLRQAHRDHVTIGYFSGSITHNDDFNMVLPALVSILERHENVELLLVGDLDLPSELDGFMGRVHTRDFCDWRDLPGLIASCDINIAPLTNNVFNEAKSENKWVEAGLVGVPTVASDIGAFAQMIHDGQTGLLCRTELDWREALNLLVTNESVRTEIGERARDFCRAHCTTLGTGSSIAKYIVSHRHINAAYFLGNDVDGATLGKYSKYCENLINSGIDAFVVCGSSVPAEDSGCADLAHSSAAIIYTRYHGDAPCGNLRGTIDRAFVCSDGIDAPIQSCSNIRSTYSALTAHATFFDLLVFEEIDMCKEDEEILGFICDQLSASGVSVQRVPKAQCDLTCLALARSFLFCGPMNDVCESFCSKASNLKKRVYRGINELIGILDSGKSPTLSTAQLGTLLPETDPVCSDKALARASALRADQSTNVLMALPSLWTSGGSLVALKHCCMLQDAGYDVTVVDDYQNANPIPYLYEFEGHEFPVIRMRPSHSVTTASLLGGKVDIAVATLWNTLLPLRGCPNVTKLLYLVQNWEPGFYPNTSDFRLGANATYACDDVGYVTISKWCSDWLERVYHREPLFAPNGIDIGLFSSSERSWGGKIRVLIEGDSESPHKNVEEAFQIASRLDPERFEIWYMSYGSGPKDEWKVDKYFHDVPHQRVPEVYSQCHILLKTSSLESFSYPPLEMMSTGGLVVAALNNGNSEYLIDGSNCLLYQLGDIEGGVEKVERLANDEALRQVLVSGGLETARNRDWHALIPQILALYE